MKQNKSLIIGILLVVTIAVVVTIIALVSSKNKKEAQQNIETPIVSSDENTLSTSTKTVAKKNANSLTFITPKNDSTIIRGSKFTVTWTGSDTCYDLKYILNPRYNDYATFISRVCKGTSGMFSHIWAVPLNVQSGTYGLYITPVNKDNVVGSVYFNLK